MRRSILAAAFLAAASPGLASDDAAYRIDVEVRLGGRTVAAAVEAPAGGVGVATAERRIPYAAALASAEPDDLPALSSVVVANTFKVAPSERDGGLAVSAEIALSRLAGRRRVESGGRAADLPEVESVGIVLDGAAMRREGDAWVYEGDDAASGARLRLVARR